MSTDNIQLQLQDRTELGKALKTVRAAGGVPAIIQESGKETKNVTAVYTELAKAYAAAGQRHPIELTVSGGKQLAVIKEIEIEPVKRQILHVVFQAIKANVKITAEIPLEYLEVEIPAEKAGLIILKTLDQVEVEALPNNVPDTLKVDASKLEEVGQKLTVADITVVKDVEILTAPETVIAVVEEPRVAEEESAPAEDEAAEEVPAEHGDEATDNVGETDTKSE